MCSGKLSTRWTRPCNYPTYISISRELPLPTCPDVQRESKQASPRISRRIFHQSYCHAAYDVQDRMSQQVK